MQSATQQRRWILIGAAGAVVLVVALLAVYFLSVRPGIAEARRVLDDYAEARRRGDRLDTSGDAQRVHANEVLATSTSLQVDVANWLLQLGGLWVCFEGSVDTPNGRAPFAAAVSGGNVLPVSQRGCRCLVDENSHFIDCP